MELTINRNTAMDQAIATMQMGIGKSTFNEWLEYVDTTHQATKETYKKEITQFMMYLAYNGISHPTRKDVIAFRDSLFQEHTKYNTKTNEYETAMPLKATTIKNYLTAIKLFFVYCDENDIYKNIAKGIKNPVIDNEHKKDYLNIDQLNIILNSIDTDTERGMRDYAMIRLMASCGLRATEIMNANINDLATRGNKTVLYILGKGKNDKTRYVVIDTKNESAIRKYLATRKAVSDSDPLFVSISNHNANERMTTRSISRIVKETYARNGFLSDRLTCHSLRHSFATNNLKNGGTLEQTQQVLGHKNIATTMIYNHAIERESNISETRISGLLD